MPNPLERLKPMETGKEAMETGRDKVGKLLGKAKELGQLKEGNKMLGVDVGAMAKKVADLNPKSSLLEKMKKDGKMNHWTGAADFGFRQMGNKTEKGI